MILTPALRKVALTAHITTSVGWLGTVACFLALAILGLTSHDAPTMRAVYPALALTTRFVIFPLSIASLATGLVVSLGGRWGLFRHYWVLVKLLLNLLSIVILLLYTPSLDRLVQLVAEPTLSNPDLAFLQTQAVVHSSAALLVLLLATVLSVYKPQGLTAYGQRKQEERRKPGEHRDERHDEQHDEQHEQANLPNQPGEPNPPAEPSEPDQQRNLAPP